MGDEKVHRKKKKSRLLCTVRKQSLKQFFFFKKKVLFKNLTSNATHSIPVRHRGVSNVKGRSLLTYLGQVQN